MNRVILIGRIARDVDVRYGQSGTAVAKYTLAVDRKTKDDKSADFISCVVFGKGAEFAQKYLHKGIKIAVTGRLQTGSYDRQDGTKAYTTDVIVEEQEFCEKKQDVDPHQPVYEYQAEFNQTPQMPQNQPNRNGQASYQQMPQTAVNGQRGAFKSNNDGFMSIPDGYDDGVPFA